MLNSNTRNHLTVCKQMINIKQDLALDNLQGLICYKNQPTNLLTYLFYINYYMFNYIK